MPSTTDEQSLSAIGTRALRDGARSHRLIGPRRERTSGHPILPGANVYYLSTPSPDQSRSEPKRMSLLRLWWARWRERRSFARELPWLADEVLEDYGLTRDEARRICRRPFWRA
ncbi:DUF1127 domain-containing protein [Bradyrhizobium sp. USDA 4353]